MTTSSSTGVPDSEMGELSRLSGVFFEPRRAFADIAARPRFWVPMVLLILTGLSFNYAFSHRVGWEASMRRAMDTNSRTQNIPMEQREAIIQKQAAFVPIMGYAGSVIGVPVYTLMVAGIMILIFNTFLGADLTFKSVFGITSYAMLPGVIAGAVGLLVMFLKAPEDFDIQQPTAFNLGVLLDAESTPKWLSTFAGSFDLFTLWMILLLATGLAVASKRLSWGTSLAAVAVPWLLWVAARSAFAGLFA